MIIDYFLRLPRRPVVLLAMTEKLVVPGCGGLRPDEQAASLQGKLAVNFHLNIVVQVVEVIAIAIEADITGLDALR